jgi:hypothetical protein
MLACAANKESGRPSLLVDGRVTQMAKKDGRRNVGSRPIGWVVVTLMIGSDVVVCLDSWF